jgi:hypothetical protein
MSQLPEVDMRTVAQRLSLKLSDQIFQTTQLEVLAEALRDERDSALSELTQLKSESLKSPQTED